jgi:hypothetical protein
VVAGPRAGCARIPGRTCLAGRRARGCLRRNGRPELILMLGPRRRPVGRPDFRRLRLRLSRWRFRLDGRRRRLRIFGRCRRLLRSLSRSGFHLGPGRLAGRDRCVGSRCRCGWSCGRGRSGALSHLGRLAPVGVDLRRERLGQVRIFDGRGDALDVQAGSAKQIQHFLVGHPSVSSYLVNPSFPHKSPVLSVRFTPRPQPFASLLVFVPGLPSQ